MTSFEELPLPVQDQLVKAAAELRATFDGVVADDVVNEFVATSYRQLDATARVTSFLPLMAARLARQRLEAFVATNAHAADVPTVLFLCVQNAGRSQMALGWLRALGGTSVLGWSGGSLPADQLHAESVKAMAEAGIDIAAEVPKPWSTDIVGAADVVVTMGCGDDCPFYPSIRYEDWDVADPHDADLEGVRAIRDDLERRVRALLDSLGVAPDTAR